MTKEETSKVLALFSIAGVKFEGDKRAILNLWASCLDDVDFDFAMKAVKRLIKNETEMFANGLIAKVRQEAKFIKESEEIQKQNELDRKKEVLEMQKAAALIEGAKK